MTCVGKSLAQKEVCKQSRSRLSLTLLAEVQTELETCGGCPGDLGQDCGEIEGANGVQCSRIGTCIVCECSTCIKVHERQKLTVYVTVTATCLSGYQVAVDGQSCVKIAFTDMSSGPSGMVRRVRKTSGRNDTL